MNKLKYILLWLILSLLPATSSFAVEPTFDMSIRNVTTYPDPVTGADSLLTFDIYLQWTNPAVSDPFEYGASEGAIFVDHQIFNGGVIYGQNNSGSFSKFSPINSDLPVALQPNTTRCIAIDEQRDFLQYSANDYNPTVNYYINTSFPGTKIMKFKMKTSAHTWGYFIPNFKFRLTNTPPGLTQIAYFKPPSNPENPDLQIAVILSDTINNHFITESNFPLPVELYNFNSIVFKNYVSLNWSTVRESGNMGFEIERKTAGTNEWTKVGFIEGSGTVQEVREYTFKERINFGKYNYRLKQIDYNGNSEYFNLTSEVEVGLPAAYSLSQNYPNPFNPSTNIDFELPYDGKVNILLYDISGRETDVIVNEIKPAGFYTVKYNPSGLSSGIYFYRINAEGNSQHFIETKRMVLVK